MSYTCLLMVLCECACANLVSKANLNLINRTDLFMCLHVMFQISFQNSKGQKSHCKFLGVRSELLLSIYVRWKSGVIFVRRCFRDGKRNRIMLTFPCYENPFTPCFLYRKIGVYIGIHYFLIFALKID